LKIEYNGIIQSIDIDECSGTNGCSPNGLCTNTDGSYTCACKTGYDGNGFTCSGNHLFFSFSLFFFLFSFFFSRIVNILSITDQLIDIDECSTNNGGCHATLATCTNTIGSRTCACKTGYSGNGVTCNGTFFLLFFSSTFLFLFFSSSSSFLKKYTK